MTLLKKLRNQYPLVRFSEADHKVDPRNEDAFYPHGAPKPERVEGEFIRMVNPMGGADTVSVKNVDAIHSLADWHQKRAEENGF